MVVVEEDVIPEEATGCDNEPKPLMLAGWKKLMGEDLMMKVCC